MNEIKPLLQSRVLVPEARYSEFEKRLKTLNAKAERLGLDEIEVTERTLVRYASIPEYRDDGIWYSLHRTRDGERLPMDAGIVHVHEIDLRYPLIKLGDWQVIAQIEATPNGNLVFAVSKDSGDAEHAEQHRECAIGCDHCKVNRDRKVSYLLRQMDSAEYKQVGSTCLEDFTGLDPAKALFLAKMAEFVSDADGSEELGGGLTNPADRLSTRDYLARVIFLTERYGFVSSAKAKETFTSPTYSEALALPSLLQRDAELEHGYRDAYARLVDEADKIVAWYAEREAKDSFEQNVKTLLLAEDIKLERKHMAFVAAAVPTYNRQFVSVNRPEAKPSAHVGVEGQKLELVLSVDRVITFSTAFGVQHRVNLADKEGNRFSWRTSNPPDELLAKERWGKPFDTQFKIKKHDVYNGAQITEVSHLKFKGWVVEPEPKLEAFTHDADDSPEP